MIQTYTPPEPTPPSHHYYPTVGSSSPLPYCRPLPSVLIDLIAMTLCDLLPIKTTRRRSPQNPRPLPELVYFIHKITYQAGINYRTALVALIYLGRAKQNLPHNAVGNQDTCHRLFLGALLLASKFLQDTPWTPDYYYCHSTTASDATTAVSTLKVLAQSPSLISATKVQNVTPPLRPLHIVPLTNRRLCDMCNGIFHLKDIFQLELSFLQLIHYEGWVNEREFNAFVIKHRVDLSI
ncbi:cyclin [Phycomyces blakesleeanus NRRL 1555(-)]|uniref:Cyclin n=2 Tax=Phycomyces blakesleeanus TaxID=4837 RepID=A0A162T7G1_PHYB8|nr:cyclin [Phycomyces blakesleeanus NRRL 1555(-)]OAD66732.1 cyclin [Phycomyces blakesleeanus NRRL 1555(-)]|eukprot:XP_018284772.1 cyclin [Phycomyces blakesleeanus NRRL 1555(-)]